MTAVHDSSIREKIGAMQKHEATDLSKRFPGASASSISMLKEMLQLNPEKRMTVDQARVP